MAALLGPGWTTSYEQTLGEMQTGVWVADERKAQQLFPVLPAQLPRAEAAAGWGGDRLVSLDGPDGAWAVVWQTDWDSREDAREFRDAARDAMKDLPGAHAVSDADLSGGLSSPVLVLVADGDDDAGRAPGRAGSVDLAHPSRRVKRGAADDEETDTCVGIDRDEPSHGLAQRGAAP